MEHRFQINLSGLIDLLSNHLYTRPDVFVRELLQNGVDAIAARNRLGPSHEGSIQISLEGEGVVVFSDNGVGLTEDEMHRFLAVIGESSKRGDWLGSPQDYIGQFGIGLLACFIVAEEIELTSRSAQHPDAPSLRWRGRPDGTYDIERLDEPAPVGSQVRLVAKPDARRLFKFDPLLAAARHYGAILPFPVHLREGERTERVNDANPAGRFPWDASHLPRSARRDHWLEWGRRTLDEDLLDAIELRSDTGGVDGVAFVLARAPGFTRKSRHRVYLKRMLLSDSVENLLPPWAFFVQCIVNCQDLRPTAARHSFHEDASLQQTQQELGQCLRRYLLDLSRNDPERLQRLMTHHHLALKALALEDDEFFELFAPWFPLQANFGWTTLQHVLSRKRQIRVTRTVDEFRQIAQIAAAQGMDVVNGGYTYDADLMARLQELKPEIPVLFVQPSDIGQQLAGLGQEQEALHATFLASATAVLEPFSCLPRLKLFEPADLPTLYIANREATNARVVAASAEEADDLWRDVLTQIGDEEPTPSELCFNLANPLVRRLASHADATVVQRIVQVLYVQALLMGHHPLGSAELNAMSEGLSGLLEWSLMSAGSGATTWH
ncbi:HSP90 family protein [Piscinibacter terrae]|uniref:HSP90 family protein n=1 Tax=Piscinibacter terrae TaxID=2496871 RepID=A0A3N7IRU5_9BURK|nr:HSP90 family protein [Albitalea terrae]RQP21592.1 HSP90 family protein [Albitalea terrae]